MAQIEIDYGAIGGGSNNNYSTDEQKIGTWIDGKPLYRKCFKYSGTEWQNGYFINHNIANVDHIYIANGSSIVRNDGYYFTNYFATNTDCLRMLCSKTQMYYIAGMASGITVSKIFVVLEYTKTTD